MSDIEVKKKLDEIAIDVPPASGTHAHPDGVVEQTAITLTIVKKTRINNIHLDFVNLTQNTTVRTKIGGTTVDTLNWNPAMDDGVLLNHFVCDEDVTVTIQSVIAEGAIRNIDYKVF